MCRLWMVLSRSAGDRVATGGGFADPLSPRPSVDPIGAQRTSVSQRPVATWRFGPAGARQVCRGARDRPGAIGACQATRLGGFREDHPQVRQTRFGRGYPAQVWPDWQRCRIRKASQVGRGAPRRSPLAPDSGQGSAGFRFQIPEPRSRGSGPRPRDPRPPITSPRG
jgi:hypothetical protein